MHKAINRFKNQMHTNNTSKKAITIEAVIEYRAVSMASYVRRPVWSSLLHLLLPLPAICHPCNPTSAGWRLAPFLILPQYWLPRLLMAPNLPWEKQ